MNTIEFHDFSDKNKDLTSKGKRVLHEFHLSDQEAFSILRQRSGLEEGQIKFPDIYRAGDSLHEKIYLYGENNFSDMLCMTIFTFSGNYKVNRDKKIYDDQTIGLIAKQMVDKYGEPYKIAFFGYWKQKLRFNFMEKGVVEASELLGRRLEQIGKKSDQAHLVLWDNRIGYKDLEDI